MKKENNYNIPTISIKTAEKKLSKTYTDSKNTIDTLNKIAKITHRSFNDVLKEIINNFIENGKIYDPNEEKYYTVNEIIK